MNRSYLPLISCISLFLLLLLLKFFSDISQNVIISIALIMVFLIIFTYVLKTEGQTALNVCVIIFSFVCLPVFILWYLGIFNLLIWPWSIMLAIGVIILGMLSVATIANLNFVEIDLKK